MRTEVADNRFAEVDRFAASSLRMIFVGQRACKPILLISARGFAISYFVAGQYFQAIPLITLWLFMFSLWVAFYSCIITLSFMPQNDFFRL